MPTEIINTDKIKASKLAMSNASADDTKKSKKQRKLRFWKRGRSKAHRVEEEFGYSKVYAPPSPPPGGTIQLVDGMPTEINSSPVDVSVITMDSANGRYIDFANTTTTASIKKTLSCLPQAIPKRKGGRGKEASLVPLLPPMSEIISLTESGTRESSQQSSIRSMLRLGGNLDGRNVNLMYDNRNTSIDENKHYNNSKGDKKAKVTNFLTRTKVFRSLAKSTFKKIDTDQSGFVDKNELYAGLLHMHLQLGSYFGPAACRPVNRESVDEIFAAMDTDNSGHLDEHEFINVMMIMCAHILSRVAVQWSLTLLIVPIFAEYILDANLIAFHKAISLWENHFCLVDDAIFLVRTYVVQFLSNTDKYYYNGSMAKVIAIISRHSSFALEFIPDSLWSSIPLAVMSCLLTLAAVPYTLSKIDSFFSPQSSTGKSV